MVEQEHKALLNRTQHIGHVEQHFSESLAVLRDMTNYGTNLLPRCLVTSKKTLKDAIILGVMLRQALTMFDAIEILIANASIYPAHLQSRALFEVSVYIDWALKTATDERCAYYYVANLRRDRLWALSTQGGSAKNVSDESAMAAFEDVAPETSRKLFAEGTKRLDEVNAVLAQPRFLPIDQAFETYRKKHKLTYEPLWHAPLGQKTVRQLAKELDRLREYDVFYSLTSEVVHATSQKSHIHFAEGLLYIDPIRNLEGIDFLLPFSMSMMIHIYRSILEHYRPDELQNFKRKYMEDWREQYRNIQRVRYHVAQENRSI